MLHLIEIVTNITIVVKPFHKTVATLQVECIQSLSLPVVELVDT